MLTGGRVPDVDRAAPARGCEQLAVAAQVEPPDVLVVGRRAARSVARRSPVSMSEIVTVPSRRSRPGLGRQA